MIQECVSIFLTQGPEDSTCFDDYSKIEPMKHEFVLTEQDQKQFADF
jgi:hypothetical protein